MSGEKVYLDSKSNKFLWVLVVVFLIGILVCSVSTIIYCYKDSIGDTQRLEDYQRNSFIDTI